MNVLIINQLFLSLLWLHVVVQLFFQQRRTRSAQRRGRRVLIMRHRRQEYRSSQIPVLLSDHVEIPRRQHRTNRKFSRV